MAVTKLKLRDFRCFLPSGGCRGVLPGSETENVFVLCANSRLHEARRKCFPHNSKYILFVRRQDTYQQNRLYSVHIWAACWQWYTVQYNWRRGCGECTVIPLEEGCGGGAETGWRSACASRTASVLPEEPLYRNFTLSLSFGIRGSYWAWA